MRCLAKEQRKQWDLVLPRDEYAYNDLINRRIRKIRFKVVYGMKPRGVFELRDLKGVEKRSVEGDTPVS